jgi:hypothetical protein
MLGRRTSYFTHSQKFGSRRLSELDYPDVQATIKSWLPTFLKDVADILRGAEVIDKKSPDEKFIDGLEAALRVPVALTYDPLRPVQAQDEPSGHR